MLTPKMQKLEDAKLLVAELELAVAAELASLPTVYGFASVDEFIVAVQVAKGRRGPGRPKKAKAAKKPRRRAKITDATRASVKSMVKAGKTGAEIAQALKISLPSVQNIKKALGLVTSRAKSPAKAKPAARKKAKKAAKVAKAKTPPKPKKKAPKAPRVPKTPASEPTPTSAAPEPAESAPPAAT